MFEQEDWLMGMKAVIIDARWGALVGRSCRCCPRKILAGQTVLVAHLPNVEWGDDFFAAHAECLQRAAAAAPAGAGPRDHDRRGERRRARTLARRRAVEALCARHADELAAITDDELVVATIAGG
jgi:hypothetical protein